MEPEPLEKKTGAGARVGAVWKKKSGAGLGSRSWSEPSVFGSLEPEPESLGKKRGAGAAWKKKSGAGAGKN